MDKFLTLLKKAKPDYQPPELLYALDPGETTGLAIFRQGQLDEVRQLNTDRVIPQGVNKLQALFLENPDIVVYENYVVYNWKAQKHSWNTLHTPRLIGAIQALGHIHQIPMYTQMAQQPKQFCTDERLKEWNYYTRGLRHGRDAVRHGCYYMLFNAHKASNL